MAGTLTVAWTTDVLITTVGEEAAQFKEAGVAPVTSTGKAVKPTVTLVIPRAVKPAYKFAGLSRTT